VLTTDQVYALTAFILQMNGVVAADMVLTETTLPRVQMPNRGGFVEDPRPDVH
jgi:cytochrome c